MEQIDNYDYVRIRRYSQDDDLQMDIFALAVTTIDAVEQFVERATIGEHIEQPMAAEVQLPLTEAESSKVRLSQFTTSLNREQRQTLAAKLVEKIGIRIHYRLTLDVSDY